MRKTLYNIAVFCLFVAAVSSSCAKEDNPEGDEKTGATFVATMADVVETKTTMSDPDGTTSSISWSTGDEISVNGNKLQVVGTPSGKTATFSGRVVVSGVGGKYYASYNCGTVNVSSGSQSFSFPTSQEYCTTPGQYGVTGTNSIPMLAVADVPATITGPIALEFKNACAIIDIKLKGGISVGKIVLSASEKLFTGTVSMAADGTISFSNGGESGNDEVSLSMATPVALDANSYKHFCIKVPPIASGKKLTVKIFKSSSDTVPYTSGVIEVGSSAYDLSNLVRVPVVVVDDQLPGIFSISATEKVRFSKGNLQYQKSTDTFQFAEKQWYHYGYQNNAQSNGGNTFDNPDDKWIDMLAWGSSGYNKSCWPWTNNQNTDNWGCHPYLCNMTNTAYDWGVYNYFNSGWRTLSIDEWQYLFGKTGNNYNNKWGKGKVNDVIGIILVPEGFSDPGGNAQTKVSGRVTFISNDEYSGTDYNIYSSTNWDNMETAGAVFLPQCGMRNPNQGSSGSLTLSGWTAYWSSTCNYNYYNSKVIKIGSQSSWETGDYSKRCGFPVRLVKDVSSPEPSPSDDDYIDEYGYNRGQGISSGGYTWAPVNCGYAEAGLYDKKLKKYTEAHENGKLYQWGRKDGQGHVQSPGVFQSSGEELIIGDYKIYNGQFSGSSSPDPNKFYYNSGSWSSFATDYWGDENMNSYNPCPDGWTVPTKSQLSQILATNKDNISLKTLTIYYRYNVPYSSLHGCVGATYYYYWTRDKYNENQAYAFKHMVGYTNVDKAWGSMVRCVKKP